MVERGMVVVPTLAIRSPEELEVALANLRAFTQSGGRAIYGTDLGNSGTSPGIDQHELRLMASAGMSPMDVLRSATVAAAEWLNLSSTGSLECGRDADIIVLGRDPLDRLKAVADVKMVFRKGRRVA
jgi:imidazolonepropionase-like amidohydrolase